MQLFGSGASDFIGSAVACRPVENGHNITALARSEGPAERLARLTLALVILMAAAGCTDEPRPETASEVPTAAESDGAPALPSPDSADVTVIPPDSVTRARFEEAMAFAQRNDLASRPPGEIMQALGRRYLGGPYLTKPLDQTTDEQLVCRLDGFDCFTFDEAVIALARTVKEGRYSYDDYRRYTRELRYRDGEMSYCNRLHYYTEFVHQAEEQGVLRNVTAELGGRQRPGFRYAFMGEHRDAYPQLVASDSLYACIQAVEDRLNRIIEYRYIPQDSIRAVYDQLHAGDLIATATDIDGLDVTHTGLVYKAADTTGLLHASTTGEVKISPDLAEYVQGVDSQVGIIVARPVFGDGR